MSAVVKPGVEAVARVIMNGKLSRSGVGEIRGRIDATTAAARGRKKRTGT